MKSRLRFVLILGILGLLTSLVAIGPAFADTGKVALKGGALDTLGVAEGKFFSDKQGFNIVTATTADDDLSPVRTGVAIFDFDGVDALRGLPGGGSGAFNLRGTAVIKPIFNSEKDEAKKFSGNTSLAFGTVTDTQAASTTILKDRHADFVAEGVAVGDIITNSTDSATCRVLSVNINKTQLTCEDDLTGGAFFNDDDAYTVGDASFDLGDMTDPKNRGRNRDADVNLNIDDVLAKVSGTEVVVESVTTHPNVYITGNVILTNAPSTGIDNVVITIGISEYDQNVPLETPISSASFAFGTAAFNRYAQSPGGEQH